MLVHGVYHNQTNRSQNAQPIEASAAAALRRHGHQSDSFTCDDDARNGWALTQQAFVESLIRDLEALKGKEAKRTRDYL